MKKIILIWCLLCTQLIVEAQYRNDKWLLGVKPSLLMNFQKDSTVNSIIYTTKSIRFQIGHSNINDSFGVKFSCTGFNIINNEGDIMENGSNILPLKFTVGTSLLGSSNYQQHSIISGQPIYLGIK